MLLTRALSCGGAGLGCGMDKAVPSEAWAVLSPAPPRQLGCLPKGPIALLGTYQPWGMCVRVSMHACMCAQDTSMYVHVCVHAYRELVPGSYMITCVCMCVCACVVCTLVCVCVCHVSMCMCAVCPCVCVHTLCVCMPCVLACIYVHMPDCF